MQQTEQAAGWSGAKRKRMETVAGTLATPRCEGENLAELAHDARNMVTALGLYCDLLEEPGVLATPFAHYGNELRLVAAASRRLVEKLVALDTRDHPEAVSLRFGVREAGERGAKAEPVDWFRQARRLEMVPALPIESLARELLANRNLLAALAGSAIALTVVAEGSARPVRLTGEDLTRVLVNLVKNSAEAMPAGGTIQLRLREQPCVPGAPQWLSLTVEDNGPGIPPDALDKVFEAGFSTRSRSLGHATWPAAHRGLGLSITRSIMESAGCRISAANRDRGGARFEIELPVRKR